MKKSLFCLILALSSVAICQAQNLDNFLKRVSKSENVETVKISGLMMFLGKKFARVNDIPLAKGVKSLEVYTLSECSDNLKKDFTNLFYNLKDGNGYETLIYTKDGNDGVRILVNKKKDEIHDLVLMCMDEDDPTVIKFSGKIKEKEIVQLVNSKINRGYKSE